MNKSTLSLSILMAGLLATAGAQAQTAPVTAAPEVPVSTKDQIRQDAQGRDAASATTTAPGRAGEASTMVNGNPNANPNDPALTKSRAEKRTEKSMKKAEKDAAKAQQMMGNTGYGAAPTTPAVAPAGTPAATEGGTPK
jgi:hypothetical protein